MGRNLPKGITYTFPEQDDLEAKERTKELLVEMVVDYIRKNRREKYNIKKDVMQFLENQSHPLTLNEISQGVSHEDIKVFEVLINNKNIDIKIKYDEINKIDLPQYFLKSSD